MAVSNTPTTPETNTDHPENSIFDVQKNETRNDFVTQYFIRLKNIFTKPSDFFSKLNPPYSATHALLFAVVTHWLGASLSFLWKSAVGSVIETKMQDFLNLFDQVVTFDHELRDQFLHWIWGVGSVLIDPFTTIIGILFTSFFVWLASRLLGNLDAPNARSRLKFEAAVTVVSYGMTASLLSIIPIVGSILAPLFTMVLTVIAAREIYKVTSGRAIVIALFPKILFALLMLGVFAFILFIAAQLMLAAFI